jgi:hypothetical protein
VVADRLCPHHPHPGQNSHRPVVNRRPRIWQRHVATVFLAFSFIQFLEPCVKRYLIVGQQRLILVTPMGCSSVAIADCPISRSLAEEVFMPDF